MSNKIKELEAQIKKHNHLYWVENNPEISDIEYDNLVRELEKLDPNNSILQELGSEEIQNSGKKIVHEHQMLSLGKVYSKEELLRWVEKVSRNNDEKFLIQPKYDGISGKIEKGILSSRGTGKIGLDYSDKLPLIKIESTKSLPNPEKIDFLLGEIVITNSDFKSIFNNVKSKAGTQFKNQRNAVAGIMGTDDVSFYKKQNASLTFVDYEKNSWITTCGLFEDDWDDIANSIQTTSNYPLDGIVIKLADKEYSASLGNTTHHPRGQIAFKFTNNSATSKLLDVEFSMGKEQFAAVGIIEPIEMNGVTIKRVKLQLTEPVNSEVNSYLLDGSLQIGDEIVVERAGDIIPHIISSKPGKSRRKVYLNKCPFCGGDLKITKTSVQCLNENCTEKIIQKLYCSIVTLGFKGVGEAYIRNIVSELNISKLSQIFQLQLEDLKSKCFGTKMKELFISERDKCKNSNFETFLAALNIPSLGKNVSKLLVENFSTKDILNINFSFNDLIQIHGIGEISAKEVIEGMKRNFQEIQTLAKYFNFQTIEKSKQENDKGTICFTGKMEHKRSEMEQFARSIGYEPLDSVSKDLTILVCADPNSGSSKLQKAKKNGTKIISEIEFMKMIK
jgi:DNA ligase (NAD+)